MSFSSFTSALKVKTHSQLTHSPFKGIHCLFSNMFLWCIGKELTKWIENATGERDKPLDSSPVHKSESEARSSHSKSSETSSSKRRGEKHQHSRHAFKSHQKEPGRTSVKSDSKGYSHGSSREWEPRASNHPIPIHHPNHLESSQASDSENFHKNNTWNEEHNPKELHNEVISDRDNQKRHDRVSYSRHKHKDRHHRNNSDHHRDSYSRHKHKHRHVESHNVDLHNTDSKLEEGLENVSKEETGESPGVVEGESGEPRLQSLDSRIQSLLGGIGLGTLGSPPHVEPPAMEEDLPTGHPPLPSEPAPPFPSEYAPPLPDEDAPPPLPPEPQPHFSYSLPHKTDPKLTPLTMFVPNGHTLNANKRSSADEDDRMSLSSIGSDEEKIEVNPPTLPSELPPPPQPPLPPLPPMPWQLPPPIDAVQNQAFQNQTSNSAYDQALLSSGLKNSSKSSFNLNHLEELKEGMFTEVLDQVINQLKFIMRKDLCKKMVQDTAFSTYDKWWSSEQQCDKVCDNRFHFTAQ